MWHSNNKDKKVRCLVCMYTLRMIEVLSCVPSRAHQSIHTSIPTQQGHHQTRPYNTVNITWYPNSLAPQNDSLETTQTIHGRPQVTEIDRT
jgi:hypothetical protein